MSSTSHLVSLMTFCGSKQNSLLLVKFLNNLLLWVLNTCLYLWFFVVFLQIISTKNTVLNCLKMFYSFNGFKTVVLTICLKSFKFCFYLLFFLLSYDSILLSISKAGLLSSCNLILCIVLGFIPINFFSLVSLTTGGIQNLVTKILT